VEHVFWYRRLTVQAEIARQHPREFDFLDYSIPTTLLNNAGNRRGNTGSAHRTNSKAQAPSGAAVTKTLAECITPSKTQQTLAERITFPDDQRTANLASRITYPAGHPSSLESHSRRDRTIDTESEREVRRMPRPGVIMPRAPLVRDAVRIDLAAQDGEIADDEVTRRARFILSFMTETEQVSLSSRGKIEGYDPPIERFSKAAEAFITTFGLDEMLASFDGQALDEEPPRDPGEDPPEINDNAGSQRGEVSPPDPGDHSPGMMDNAGSQHGAVSPPSLEEQLPGIDDYNAGSQRESSPGVLDKTARRTEQPIADRDAPAGAEQFGSLTHKRKLPSLFQTSRKASLSSDTGQPSAFDSPASQIDWGGVGEEKDSSEEPTPLLNKGKQPVLRAYAAERDELELERRIRAEHRVTASEQISASALISALQTHQHNVLLVTPPNQNRSPPSTTSTASGRTCQRHRFSVDEFGSPGFSAPEPPLAKDTNWANQLWINPASTVAVEAKPSPQDIKIEDAPPALPPQSIPGAWSPPIHIKFGEFGVDIPGKHSLAVDRELKLPDATPENDQYKQEVLFYDSKGEPPRLSLPPTPIPQKPIVVPDPEQKARHPIRRPFTPTYPPPASYGSWFAPAIPDASQENTQVDERQQDKATQTDDDMTSKKVEALEELMKQLIVANDQMNKANEKRDETLTAILARLSNPGEYRAEQPGDAEKARKEAILRQLEEERLAL
jgi:hypothetical protein